MLLVFEITTPLPKPHGGSSGGGELTADFMPRDPSRCVAMDRSCFARWPRRNSPVISGPGRGGHSRVHILDPDHGERLQRLRGAESGATDQKLEYRGLVATTARSTNRLEPLDISEARTPPEKGLVSIWLCADPVHDGTPCPGCWLTPSGRDPGSWATPTGPRLPASPLLRWRRHRRGERSCWWSFLW
jgi:hypothetical protein